MTFFQPTFRHAQAFGVLAATPLPAAPAPVPDEVLAQLLPEEAAHARTLGGFRQVDFVGGRLALHEAMRAIGAPAEPVLPDERGTPTLPEGWTASISHKRHLAVALLARDTEGTLGVDLEQLHPARPSIASRVLRPAELEAIASLDPDRRWIALLQRFSLKEAIYKALDPHVRRYVGFHEAEVHPTVDGPAHITLHLEQGEGPFLVEGRHTWLGDDLLSTVRIRPLARPPVPHP